MQDLYSLSYHAFMLFLNKMNERYDENKKILKQIIIDVLTNKNSIFNKDLEEFLDKNINIEACKRVIMYFLISKSYIMNYYDYIHEINISYCYPFLEELEDLNKDGILDLFYKPDETTNEIIDDFFAYITRPYIFMSKSKELIINDGKLSTLLKINPFEALDIWDYILDEDLTEPEKFIQIFFDIYDKSIAEAVDDPNGEKENYEGIEAFEHAMLIKNINEYFENDINKVTIFLSYIISNVYECLIVEKDSSGINNDLIVYLEEADIYELRDEFINNNEFAFRIMDIFEERNSTLLEDELLNKREQFKRCGDVLLLKRLNPYYDAEEIVYQKMKETSEFN